MVKDRQVKLLCILTPKEFNFFHNENGYFFKKEGKGLKWCIEFRNALDFVRLIRKERERHWWESDSYINEYV